MYHWGKTSRFHPANAEYGFVPMLHQWLPVKVLVHSKSISPSKALCLGPTDIQVLFRDYYTLGRGLWPATESLSQDAQAMGGQR